MCKDRTPLHSSPTAQVQQAQHQLQASRQRQQRLGWIAEVTVGLNWTVHTRHRSRVEPSPTVDVLYRRWKLTG